MCQCACSTIIEISRAGLTTGPHKNIVATFGAVAQHNGTLFFRPFEFRNYQGYGKVQYVEYPLTAFGFVPFLTDIFSRAVPLLPHVKTEPARYGTYITVQ